MILVIDNYDSFSYNLVQLIGTLVGKKNPNRKIGDGEIKVIRNDELTIQEIKKLNPSHIILSPGPGKPKDAGICEALIKECCEQTKILGVCLGHQAICEVFGATITYANELMHGKQSEVTLSRCKLFAGLSEKEAVGRYHSLIAKKDTIPACLEVIAVDEKGEIMAVKHKEYEMYGLQFHPESILTEHGEKILSNFLYE